MQAATLLAVIVPTPAATASGPADDPIAGVALGAASADPNGHDAVIGGGAGDAFAQALAALMGLPQAQTQPQLTTSAPQINAAAPAAPSAFGASLLQAGAGKFQPSTPSPLDAAAAATDPAVAVDLKGAVTTIPGIGGPGIGGPGIGGPGIGGQNELLPPSQGASSAGAPASHAASPAILDAKASGPIIISAAIAAAAAAPTPGPAAAVLALATTLVTLVASVLTQPAPDSSAKDDSAADATFLLTASAEALAAAAGASAKPSAPPAGKAALAAKSGAPPAAAGDAPVPAPDAQLAARFPKATTPPPMTAAPSGGGYDKAAGQAGAQAASAGADAASAADLSFNATLPVAAPLTAQASAALAAASGPAIASQIADQVIKSVDGKSTRFDIALDPAGLGQVNVKVEINDAGLVSASLSFDNAHAAAEARAHVGELQRALEQAGFNLSQAGLSFDVGGQGASLARQNQGQPFTDGPRPSASNQSDAAEPIPPMPASPRIFAACGVNILI
jgi:flagellar hook-length control protein FliK